jgi:hypothetical protein
MRRTSERASETEHCSRFHPCCRPRWPSCPGMALKSRVGLGRFFKVRDLHDLFTLGDDTENGTETGDLFADVADEMVADPRPQPNGRARYPLHPCKPHSLIVLSDCTGLQVDTNTNPTRHQPQLQQAPSGPTRCSRSSSLDKQRGVFVCGLGGENALLVRHRAQAPHTKRLPPIHGLTLRHRRRKQARTRARRRQRARRAAQITSETCTCGKKRTS